jgi:fructose-specific component phosphotransferase system IIB-like protein
MARRDAAIVMLSGQVADGLMTILAGEMVPNQLYKKLCIIADTDSENLEPSAVLTDLWTLCCVIVRSTSLAVSSYGT